MCERRCNFSDIDVVLAYMRRELGSLYEPEIATFEAAIRAKHKVRARLSAMKRVLIASSRKKKAAL